MLYVDNRLCKALSDNRLEQANHQHQRRALAVARRNQVKKRLGHLLVAKGEDLAGKQTRAA